MNQSSKHIENLGRDEIIDLVRHWYALSSVQRRTILALAKEVDTASELVETSVNGLSERFLDLANLAQTQAERVGKYARETGHIDFEGEAISLSHAFSKLDEDIGSAVLNLIRLSQQGVEISYTINDLETRLGDLLDQLTSGTETDQESLIEEISDVRNELKETKQLLTNVTASDITDNIKLKERLGELLSYMISQSHNLENALDDSIKDCAEINASIADIVTRMQFQDRTSQRLSHISGTLNVVGETLKEMEKSSNSLLGHEAEPVDDAKWIEKMITDMHLGEMRERFVKHAMFDNTDHLFAGPEPSDEVDFSEASDDIELF